MSSFLPKTNPHGDMFLFSKDSFKAMVCSSVFHLMPAWITWTTVQLLEELLCNRVHKNNVNLLNITQTQYPRQ